MLGEQNIVKKDDVELIKKGLKQSTEEITAGNFTFDASDEDIHMAIEKRLTEIIGPAGGRLTVRFVMTNAVSTVIFISVMPLKNVSD